MAKTITVEEFSALLQKAQYAIVGGYEGIYKIDDGYTSKDYPADTWALVNMEDKSDVIVLAEYLDSPEITIEYDMFYGTPIFTLDGAISWTDAIEITLLKTIKL